MRCLCGPSALLLHCIPLLQARKQNPKAFVFSSRGKAKLQKARTAEKEQRRMHGAQQAAAGGPAEPLLLLDTGHHPAVAVLSVHLPACSASCRCHC